MQGHAVEKVTSLEVVAAWTVPKTPVPAVAATPGWYVLGEYFLPKSTTARLDAIMSVSASGLTARVRLWDTVENEAVPGPVITTSLTNERVVGGTVTLKGGQSYQIQAECIGGTGDDKFANIETATITDSSPN